MLLQVEIMVLFGWKVFGRNDNVLQMLLLKILPKNNNWIFFFVLQHCTVISDCSLPPLGCNWLNFQKLWKNSQLCPKTSKRKVFWEKTCHNWGNPTFLTYKNKTTWAHHTTEPSGEKHYYFLYMQSCYESSSFSTSQEHNKWQPPLQRAYTSPKTQAQHIDKTNISNRLE